MTAEDFFHDNYVDSKEDAIDFIGADEAKIYAKMLVVEYLQATINRNNNYKSLIADIESIILALKVEV